MLEIEPKLHELIQQAEQKGYKIVSANISYTHRLKRATVRIRIEPYPGYDQRRGDTHGTLHGSLEKLTEYITKLEHI